VRIIQGGPTVNGYILAIDQGTTSSKAFVINKAGEIVGQAGHAFNQIYPQPGWVEHNPVEIWETQKKACRDAVKDASIETRELVALGITNQRETTVVWDRETGRPVTNAIVWQCRRTSDLCERLIAQGRQDAFRKKTGLLIDAYFSATKLQWILQTIPHVMERARRGELCFGTIDSWLVFNLTGGKVHATDPSNASRTMLFNINDRTWDREILDWLEIPDSMLPRVLESSCSFGLTDPEVLGAEIPITGIAGDQQAALFGQGCFNRGDMKNTYGTGCFVLANLGDAPLWSPGLLTSVGWSVKGQVTYVLEGSVFVAGAAVQWLRDNLGIIGSSAEIEALARSVPDTGGVYFLPAFVGLGAPYWDMYARGTIVGITRGTSQAHLARATLEAISHQSADVVEMMKDCSGRFLSALKVDGGAAENDLLMETQADILGVDVARPANLQTTALGAAYLAGLECGYWKGLEELPCSREKFRVFTPRMAAAQRHAERAKWRKLIEAARVWGDVLRTQGS
jgi:glycerol kinase